MIRSYVTPGRCALVVSSDAEELCALADRVVVLDRGHIVDELDGTGLTADTIDRLTQRSVLA
jgi:ABC-type sugar transport system ATPase subunit